MRDKPAPTPIRDMDLARLPLVDDDQAIRLEDPDNDIGKPRQPFQLAHQDFRNRRKRDVPGFGDSGQGLCNERIERGSERCGAVRVGSHAGMVPPSCQPTGYP
jgi:hypothetical protein